MARIAVTFAPDALPDQASRRLVDGLRGHDVTFAEDGGWTNLRPMTSPHTRRCGHLYMKP